MKLYSSFLLLTTLGGSDAIDIGALVGGGGGGLGDATMGLDPIILMKLMGSLSSCDIDVLGTGMALAAVGTDPENMNFDALASILNGVIAPVDNECSAEDEQTFRGALGDFKSCSGVDLETLMETWPSASIGELMNCGTSLIKSVQVYAPLLGSDVPLGSEEEPLKRPKVEFSDHCINQMYGPNPMGDFGRLLWKHPGVMCDCLGSFSKAAPACTIEEYPIPLVGNWMRKASCIINSAVCPMLEQICSSELKILDQCLPPVSNSNYDCEAAENKCLQDPSFLDFPQEMTGAPLPDTCQTVAGYAEFKSKKLVERYDQHINECVTKWEGWSDDYVSKPITTTKQLVAAAAVSNKPVVKQSMGGFVGGMVVASVLFAGVAFLVYKRNSGGLSVPGYNTMALNGFELS
eukprot:CAMPEP_0194166848 /NCGR_PEP_ID=MMETSP0154-20130528/2348_1 /TAXON_ID=1049557 /ORGANISM="Thalassiothrix antarctica, Strain L6-D1" /LENGTH=404 /DNA_ID=CAMNT_0038877637 /DNA_START=39 /DNA_END=1253 /DNA_ORIENTATION=+